VAGLQDLLGELVEELVVELLGDDETLRGIAGLAGVVEAGVDGGLDRAVQVVGREQDERVGPAELERIVDAVNGACR
ncbi:MAG TPA: hypothetical protein PK089_09885, partial [Methanoregulaceae archaeon]|nr:hypothetical protein [Methanoregulaceae archaeon]